MHYDKFDCIGGYWRVLRDIAEVGRYRQVSCVLRNCSERVSENEAKSPEHTFLSKPFDDLGLGLFEAGAEPLGSMYHLSISIGILQEGPLLRSGSTGLRSEVVKTIALYPYMVHTCERWRSKRERISRTIGGFTAQARRIQSCFKHGNNSVVRNWEADKMVQII